MSNEELILVYVGKSVGVLIFVLFRVGFRIISELIILRIASNWESVSICSYDKNYYKIIFIEFVWLNVIFESYLIASFMVTELCQVDY